MLPPVGFAALAAALLGGWAINNPMSGIAGFAVCCSLFAVSSTSAAFRGRRRYGTPGIVFCWAALASAVAAAWLAAETLAAA